MIGRLLDGFGGLRRGKEGRLAGLWREELTYRLIFLVAWIFTFLIGLPSLPFLNEFSE